MKSITLFVQTAILWVVSLVVAALGGAAAGALGVFYLWSKYDEEKAEREPYGMKEITRRFDNESRMWSDDLEVVALFVRHVQTWANDRLDTNGHMFLNEVYDQMGLRRTHHGQLAGWNESRVVIAVKNPTDQSVELTFNIDGEIWDDEKTWTKLWPEG